MIIVSYFFFFKQKTAYEMRISDWSSDVLFRSLLEPGVDVSWYAVDVDADELVLSVPRRFRRLVEDQREQAEVDAMGAHPVEEQIGRAACRERVCQYV